MGPDNRFGQNEAMPKVDILKDAGKLKSTDIVYMKRLEEQNLERAKRVHVYRKANNRMAIALGLGVIGIYAYTIYSVKQEKFLDDFEVPEKTVELVK
ncbi:PREDICTED: cytochrome c oxidase assembly factor 3, mitochondrial [Vollenhovia emeryi]|uniref:cytochrome c oxidase assembly factor 3, mitochondrial n=1 Tax=Vollenhovia emeryi TaxID=411798 RepID=UPI0005F3EAF9|nr:PREDICTED: cytochrome c oxidase assembly factor 3, mitochondrial [Vollenhovia emeryi]XP_011882655.1 PREDICTED: cytochrome c oxidase assembly factor 3, mitochondrial [Vollenhovia emeryi]XP_011882656.1 PREDICTED: cytochrome c oxidase assembly factor 3, mitochondrial [Vollenhovia emeryi]